MFDRAPVRDALWHSDSETGWPFIIRKKSKGGSHEGRLMDTDNNLYRRTGRSWRNWREFHKGRVFDAYARDYVSSRVFSTGLRADGHGISLGEEDFLADTKNLEIAIAAFGEYVDENEHYERRLKDMLRQTLR